MGDKKLEQQMIKWRHNFHQQPEFGFEEYKTSDEIARILTSLGLEVHRNIGNTGMVALLKNGTSSRSIGLRADIDALKILEQTDLPYKSEIDGMMHACGHDGHTSMLLGAAADLVQNPTFDGTVYFIFQPAEEHGIGAKAMIKDGLFERFNIDAVYAIHNFPTLEVGKLITKSGSIMASESSFEIEIIATGGHAAMPDKGTDPIVVGAQIVLAIQTIVSRKLNPVSETGVISVTEFKTNGTVNVIPSRVTIKGDTRSFTDEALAKIEKNLEQVTQGICLAAGVDYKFKFNNGFLSTINTALETEIAKRAAIKVFGEENVNAECEKLTISEDFAFMLRQRPGCYVLMGNGGVGEHGGIALHNPKYQFNDAILDKGRAFWRALVEEQLGLVK